MGRTATAQRTTNGDSSLVDRSADGVLRSEQGPRGASPIRPPRTGPVLPSSDAAASETSTPQAFSSGQQVTLHQLWFQLSVPDRQRFGHCFSAMVLKALGLRPTSTPEVKS
jgi:hypothetical protein